MVLRRFEIAFWVTPKVSASSYWVWHESWSNNAFNSASSNFTSLPLRSLSLVSKSPLLKRLNQYSHVFIVGECSPYASHSNRCPSAAQFFKLKQKSRASRKCCFIGTKVDTVRAQRRRVVYTSVKWLILIIRGKWWRFNVNIVESSCIDGQFSKCFGRYTYWWKINSRQWKMAKRKVLSVEKRAQIIILWQQGYLYREIAEILKLSLDAV